MRLLKVTIWYMMPYAEPARVRRVHRAIYITLRLFYHIEAQKSRLLIFKVSKGRSNAKVNAKKQTGRTRSVKHIIISEPDLSRIRISKSKPSDKFLERSRLTGKLLGSCRRLL